jgi:hypothetical protein
MIRGGLARQTQKDPRPKDLRGRGSEGGFGLELELEACGLLRGAPKKNKIESDVYLADDKWGR